MVECPFCGPNKCNQEHCNYTNKLKYNVIDLRGQKFGRLTPLEYKKIQKWNRKGWECACDCGNLTSVNTRDLLKGSIKSCGCLRKERMKSYNDRRPEITALNALYSKYKKSCEKRGMPFHLTIEEFESVTKKDCVYCGAKPIVKHKTKNSEYLGNGIDRFDNSIGYVLKNCLPCCSKCNTIKMDSNINDLLEHIKRMLPNLKRIVDEHNE